MNSLLNHKRITLVIPAYNEENQLAVCLQAALVQHMPFDEIIVVDNNSTDATAAVAASFSEVTLIHEQKQGVWHARTAGFDAAHGDIIARIDADTLLPSDWTQQIARIFVDPAIDAVSGSIGFTDVPFEPLFARVDLFLREFVANHLGARGQQFLFGGNMAIRKKSWSEVRNHICKASNFHEDMDLAAHMAEAGQNVEYRRELRARVSARRIDSSFTSYRPYVLANAQTYAAHGLDGRKFMYFPELLALLFYMPLRLLYRSYDQENRRFSLNHFLKRDTDERISPVAEII